MENFLKAYVSTVSKEIPLWKTMWKTQSYPQFNVENFFLKKIFCLFFNIFPKKSHTFPQLVVENFANPYIARILLWKTQEIFFLIFSIVSRILLLVFISLSIFSQECMTVEWSRPPNSKPIL